MVRLHMKQYKLSLVQALTNDDKEMQRTFCESMLEMVDLFFHVSFFSDKAIFDLCGLVNRHKVCIWGTHHQMKQLNIKEIPIKETSFFAVLRIMVPFSLKETLLQNKTI